jgi:chromosomal replication initiation ATPase DnaA
MELFKERTPRLVRDVHAAAEIAQATAKFYEMDVSEILSRRRDSTVSYARHVCWWLIRHRTPMSYPEIARLFDRDHTSVMYGVNRIAKIRTQMIHDIGVFYPTATIEAALAKQR